MKVIVYYLSYSLEEEAETKLAELKEFFPGYKVLMIIDYENTSDRIEVLDLYPPSYTQNYPYGVSPFQQVYTPNFGGAAAPFVPNPTTMTYDTTVTKTPTVTGTFGVSCGDSGGVIPITVGDPAGSSGTGFRSR